MSLRDYRIDIEKIPFFNKEAQGIALFDLVISFIVAYMIIDFFVPEYIKNRGMYYASIVPLGVIVHLLIGADTYLNRKLLSNELNIYKIIILINIYLIYYFYNN
jgi:hypothetical protein